MRRATVAVVALVAACGDRLGDDYSAPCLWEYGAPPSDVADLLRQRR